MTPDLPSPICDLPSDIVAGITPIVTDRREILCKILQLQQRLDVEKPFVVRVGGALNLYQGKSVRVQTPNAQMMIDYLAANFPEGTKIRWFVLPVQQPLQAA